MSVGCEFVDVFFRIQTVRDKYPGGWEGFLHDYGEVIGATIWFDEHLVRDGAMSSGDAQQIVEGYQERGFQTHREEDGVWVEWLDVCVSMSMGGSGRPTLPCAWIDFEPNTGAAFLKGTSPGAFVGRKW